MEELRLPREFPVIGLISKHSLDNVKVNNFLKIHPQLRHLAERNIKEREPWLNKFCNDTPGGCWKYLNCGHFVQAEMPHEIVNAIERLVNKGP